MTIEIWDVIIGIYRQDEDNMLDEFGSIGDVVWFKDIAEQGGAKSKKRMPSFQHPLSHFERSKKLLQDGALESLFYAALEFRFAVEARLSEYAERADEFAKKKSNRWKVKALAKHVNSVFGDDDLTYRFEVTSPRFDQPTVIKYTPITHRVRTCLGKIDNFLHYPGVLQCTNEVKDVQLRALLTDGLKELEKCLSGGMQGPLIRDENGHVTLMVDLERHPEFNREWESGEQMSIRVHIEPYIEED